MALKIKINGQSEVKFDKSSERFLKLLFKDSLSPLADFQDQGNQQTSPTVSQKKFPSQDPLGTNFSFQFNDVN